MSSFAELDNFLDSEEANFGLTARARQLVRNPNYDFTVGKEIFLT